MRSENWDHRETSAGNGVIDAAASVRPEVKRPTAEVRFVYALRLRRTNT